METKKLSTDKIAQSIRMNTALLGVAFTIFTFIASTNPQLLKNNNLLAMQLTLAIPLLLCSLFAKQKLIDNQKRIKEWNDYGFVTFILAYGFLINSIGILLSLVVNYKITLIFFLLNIINPITYSYMKIMDDRKIIKERIYKDSLFIIIIILLGILPSLGII